MYETVGGSGNTESGNISALIQKKFVTRCLDWFTELCTSKNGVISGGREGEDRHVLSDIQLRAAGQQSEETKWETPENRNICTLSRPRL